MVYILLSLLLQFPSQCTLCVTPILQRVQNCFYFYFFVVSIFTTGTANNWKLKSLMEKFQVHDCFTSVSSGSNHISDEHHTIGASHHCFRSLPGQPSNRPANCSATPWHIQVNLTYLLSCIPCCRVAVGSSLVSLLTAVPARRVADVFSLQCTPDVLQTLSVC